MYLVPIILAVFFQTLNVFRTDAFIFLARENCYTNKQLGCDKEFTDVYKNLSMSVRHMFKADTWFLMFYENSPDTPEKLHKCRGRLPPNTKFDKNKRLVVIVTPYLLGICSAAIYREWMVQILQRGDAQVLVVDQSWGDRWNYSAVISNMKLVAEQTAVVLANIQEDTGISSDQIYLVGQSLAAHICGIIGQIIPVARITGIDPSGPSFKEDVPLADRLDPSDAKFVDVWHTDIGPFPHVGISYNAGHIDFYINGGKEQKSCIETAFISIFKGDFVYGFVTALVPQMCSHGESGQYYKVSINPGNCQFVGVECKSWSDFQEGRCNDCGENGEKCMIMGYDTDKYVNSTTKFPRRYYVQTSLNCPYCDNRKIRLQGFRDTYESSLQNQGKVRNFIDLIKYVAMKIKTFVEF